MHIYELRINDEENEVKIFWFSTVEELERTTREQIELGARDVGVEIHYMPTQLFESALAVLRVRYDKQNNPTHKTPTRSFNKDSIETQYSKIITRIRKAILTCLVFLLLTAIVPCPKHTCQANLEMSCF